MNQQSRVKQAGSYGEGRHSSRHWRTPSDRHWRHPRRGYVPAADAGAPVVLGYARTLPRSVDEEGRFGLERRGSESEWAGGYE